MCKELLNSDRISEALAFVMSMPHVGYAVGSQVLLTSRQMETV